MRYYSVYSSFIPRVWLAILILKHPRSPGAPVPSHLSPPRLIGNLAAAVGTVLVVGLLFDYGAAWFGYQPMIFCTLLQPVVSVAYAVGVMVAAVGIIIWAVSMGKSEAGIALAIGGAMLFALPLVLPRYLGAECILLP